ncbi:unnamed protein product [Parajaminaea phylloscopi]
MAQPTKYRNVVIIGSHGGAHVARALAASVPQDVRLILIEKNDYGFYPPAALRAAVVPGAETLAVADFDAFFPSGSRHVVLRGTAVTALQEKSVTIDGQFEGSSEVQFEYALLATGSTYQQPSRPTSTKKEEVLEKFRTMQADVKRAKSILIIGGGPVGTEFAGEVRALYADKKVTLVTKGPSLIEGFKPELGKRLLNTLKKSKVDVRLQTSLDEIPEDVTPAQLLPEARSFTLSDGTQVEADFVLFASGAKPNTALVASSGFASALDQQNRVKVDPKTLRALDAKLGFYFAIGDCNDAPGPNTAVALMAQAPVAVAGLQQLLSGKGKAAKSYKEPPQILMVSYGPKDGQGVMMGLSVPSWFTAMVKSKSLFVPNWKKLYKA